MLFDWNNILTSHAKIAMPKRPLGPEGLRLWTATLKLYGLSRVERIVLEQACRELDQIADMEAALAKSTLLVTGSTGQVKVHPLVQAIGNARLRAARLIKELDLPDVDLSGDHQEDEPHDSASAANRRRASNAARARWGRSKALEASA